MESPDSTPGQTERRIDITPGQGEAMLSSRESIATVGERKVKLTEIMRQGYAYPALVKAGHVISAIDTLNRMEGLYSVPFGFQDNRVINIICDARTAELIGRIPERTKQLLPAGMPVAK